MCAAGSNDAVLAHRTFASVRGKLAKSGVPALLPGNLDATQTNPIFAIVHRADADGYDVELAFTPDCNMADACTLGEITGAKSDHSKLSGTAVWLALGVTGYFMQGGCGASCAASTMTFDYHGNRYVFSEKGGLRELRALTAQILPLSSF